MQNLADIGAAAAEAAVLRLGRAFIDGADETAAPEAGGELALPTAVFIRYAATGGESSRAVTLLKVWEADGVVYFQGQCHLRRQLRSFRADRVLELICMATGEAPDDASAWLMGHGLYQGAAVDPTREALRRCRDELSVLAYLARSDGVLDPDEVEVVIDVVMMATEDEIDRERVALHVRRLSPSFVDLDASLGRISKQATRMATLNRAMRRLVDADGTMSLGEQMAIAEIGAFIRRRVS